MAAVEFATGGVDDAWVSSSEHSFLYTGGVTIRTVVPRVGVASLGGKFMVSCAGVRPNDDVLCLFSGQNQVKGRILDTVTSSLCH